MDYRTVLLALALAAPALALPVPGAEVPAQVEAYLEPLVKRDLISGSLLLARGGQVLVAKGFGPANREWGVPNGVDTKFRLGSLSKQFTAAGILLLEQRGLLRLEDPLAKFLPGFPGGGRITLHQLLSHTSGLANFNQLPDYWEKNLHPWNLAQVIDWFKDQPVRGQPGEVWSYSNAGYTLLAAVIEKVSGKDFATFLREELFRPLGMAATGVDQHEDILGRRADGYVKDENGVKRVSYRDMPFMNGAGSLYSTVGDLLRWDRALRTDQPLSRASRERLFAPVKEHYACGWFVDRRFGRALISHSGDITGFRCDMQRFVDDDVTVILLLNLESTFTAAVARDLGAIALGEPYKPALVPEGIGAAPGVLAEVAGSYALDPRTTLVLAPRNGQLIAQAPGMPSAPAIPQADNLFFVQEWNGMLRIQRGADGQVTGLRLTQGARTIPAKRLP
ncbi:serine hydrolase domain-containing protein [Mesoterricola silvestris]|uniref:Beta-lactamase-related domain-containing protein n=1 Tax=Mesoterricola silvestris TaxID=2927979 RepID=A0AA48GY71_9BACT|nr:serine hydrolase domain-containing protein [Mesoterricola silvestris]BDU72538.1 hypothetical protein METEAL_17120 [Mesoterricola silvestris]